LGTARASECISGTSTIEVSSTTRRPQASGFGSFLLNRPNRGAPGLAVAVLQSFPHKRKADVLLDQPQQIDPGLVLRIRLIGYLYGVTSERKLVEVVRPKVDAFVLDWLQREPLRRPDFWEDRNGNCRLISALAIKLCETADTWRKLVAPVAEYVAQALWSSTSKSCSAPRLATRLTQRRKRAVKGRRSG
jgi:hypothetical protein